MDKVIISNETWEKIRRKSPALLPDNPTAMGWSAEEIRRQLYRFVLDDKDSIKSVIMELAENPADLDETRVNELISEALKDFTPPEGGGSVGSVYFEGDGEGNFIIKTTGGGSVALVGDGEGNFNLEVR